MKFLIGLTFSLLAMSASAEYCSASLKDRYNTVIRSFTEYGYSSNEACRDALRSCNYEKERLSYDRYYQGLNCEIDTFRNPYPGPVPTPRPTPTPPRDNRSCEVELRRANGDVITTFRRSSYDRRDACLEARRECEVELRFNQRQGRMPRAYCMEVEDRRDRDFVTKSCTVERVDQRVGRVIDFHTATATGRVESEVERRACEDATQECMRAARMSNRADTCIISRNHDRDDRRDDRGGRHGGIGLDFDVRL